MNTYCFVQLLSTDNQPKMKLRSARSFVFDLSPVLVFEILKYINPLLHYLVSRHYFRDAIDIDYDKQLPISLLLSLNNLGILENFKAVLLSFKFRENLEEQIAMYGDYFTMMWFQEHDITMSESVLIAVAGRGDLSLFQAIIKISREAVRVLFALSLKSLLNLMLRLQNMVT